MSQNKTPDVWKGRAPSNFKAHDLEQTHALYQQTKALYATLPQNYLEAVYGFIAEKLDGEIVEHSTTSKAVSGFLEEMLEQELVIFSMPELPAYFSLKEKVEFRAHLHAKQWFVHNQDRALHALCDTLISLCNDIVSYIPAAPTATAFTVPLIHVIPEPENVVHGIISTLMTDENYNCNVFTTVRDTLYENLCAISKITPGQATARSFVIPSDCNLQPLDMVHAYLRDTPFMAVLSLPVPYVIPPELKFSGTWVVAPHGMGKSVVLLSEIKENLERPGSMILMDAKGDLTGTMASLKSIQDRLIVIDLDPRYPLALNPFDIPRTTLHQKIELIDYIFSDLADASMTTRQTTLFRNVLPAIITSITHPTLQTFKDIIQFGPGDFIQAIDANDQLDPFIKNFMHRDFASTEYHKVREQINWRINSVMTNVLMRLMFNSPQTLFDLGALMDAGRIIVINNTVEKTGNEGPEFFGRFMLALILAEAQRRQSRPQHEKLPCYVYIDEADQIIKRDASFPDIIAKCRSQNIAMTVAHQWIGQILDKKTVLPALKNCAIRLALSDDDAKELADSFHTTAKFMTSLKPKSQFALWHRDMRNSPAIPLNVPYHNLEKEPQLSADEKIMMRDIMRQRFCNDASNLPEPKHRSAPPPSKSRPSKTLAAEDLTKHGKRWKK